MWDDFVPVRKTAPWTLLNENHVMYLEGRGIFPTFVHNFYKMKIQASEVAMESTGGDKFATEVDEAHGLGFRSVFMTAIVRAELGRSWRDYIPAVRAGLSTRGEVEYLAKNFSVDKWAEVLTFYSARKPELDRFLESRKVDIAWREMVVSMKSSDDFVTFFRGDIFLQGGVESFVGDREYEVNPMQMYHILSCLVDFYAHIRRNDLLYYTKGMVESFRSSVGAFT